MILRLSFVARLEKWIGAPYSLMLEITQIFTNPILGDITIKLPGEQTVLARIGKEPTELHPSAQTASNPSDTQTSQPLAFRISRGVTRSSCFSLCCGKPERNE
jgi:hypothetical protein